MASPSKALIVERKKTMRLAGQVADLTLKLKSAEHDRDAITQIASINERDLATARRNEECAQRLAEGRQSEVLRLRALVDFYIASGAAPPKPGQVRTPVAVTGADERK